MYKIDGVADVVGVGGTELATIITPYKVEEFDIDSLIDGASTSDSSEVIEKIHTRVFEEVSGKWVYKGSRVIRVNDKKLIHEVGFEDW